MTTTPVSTTTTHVTELPLPTRARPENSVGALIEHSGIETMRQFRTWSRSPGTYVQTVIYPILTMIMLWIVLGDSITAATGQPSVYGTVPLITLIAAMTGSMVTALGISQERATGLLGRFATMPIHRAAGLVGRLLAEGVRILVTTVLVIATGVALGFRFEQGPLAGFALIWIPVLFGMSFAVLVTALATVVNGILLANVVAIISTLLMFFNSGFVPVFAYPTWLQGFVANQPMSCAIDAMKGLSLGGPVAEPLTKTVIWSVGSSW